MENGVYQRGQWQRTEPTYCCWYAMPLADNDGSDRQHPLQHRLAAQTPYPPPQLCHATLQLTKLAYQQQLVAHQACVVALLRTDSGQRQLGGVRRRRRSALFLFIRRVCLRNVTVALAALVDAE
eukprot:2692384-Prymnesium_polylepis.1